MMAHPIGRLAFDDGVLAKNSKRLNCRRRSRAPATLTATGESASWQCVPRARARLA